MKAISRINHIGIRVRNFEISRDFYAKLGFKHVIGPIGSEPVAVIEHSSGININLILNTNQLDNQNILMDVETKHSGYTHVALEITDVESVIAELKTLGIEVTGEMKHSTGHAVFIRDPDRNVIELGEYKSLTA
jgi:lactoylglutathione lyase